MRDAGDFFPARGVSAKPRDIEGYFFALIVILKATPAGRVPPDAILLSGNKSIQKCLLLAEGYSRSQRGYDVQKQQMRRAGPLHGASPYCCQHGVVGSN